MKKEKIKALVIAPMEHPKVCCIEPTMQAFKKAVGADIMEHGKVEAKKIGKRVFAVFNQDRFLTDFAPNRRIGDDIIVGTMYVVAIRQGADLADEGANRYLCIEILEHRGVF